MKRELEENKVEPGTYVDWHKTDLSLMAIGINALNDGVYDEEEIEDIIASADFN